jgi:hypothetical protein
MKHFFFALRLAFVDRALVSFVSNMQ